MLLALDLGNTVLKAGLISEEGKILKEKRIGHGDDASFLKILKETKWPTVLPR